MITIKERFEKAYPLANYEAVYSHLVRDNKEIFNEAVMRYEQGVALEPFVIVEKVGKTYFDKYDVIEYIRSTPTLDQVIGYDLESDLFYVFPEKLVFVYPTLESYVENLIERIINSTDYKGYLQWLTKEQFEKSTTSRYTDCLSCAK